MYTLYYIIQLGRTIQTMNAVLYSSDPQRSVGSRVLSELIRSGRRLLLATVPCRSGGAQDGENIGFAA